MAKWAIFGDDDVAKTVAFAPRQAKAYCEGRKAFADGDLVTTNPFNPANEFENEEAWNRGWFSGQNGILAETTYCAV